MTHDSDLYPLVFRPIYKEKIWGGRALERLGRTLPGDANAGIGESWELADLATTSASGGGGDAEHSVVANGPLAGKTIRELIHQFGERLLGPGVTPSDDGGFPLLIKFLDARENLSVQVHPSPEYAAAHTDAHLKSEAWYIVDAEPGAVIYKGLKPGTTPDQLRAAIKANTDAAVVPLLNAIPARKGDCHYLPSGTLHALGAGVLVAEVQTPSDTTFRVYDWGRTDRELHIEQAMACIDFNDKNNLKQTDPEFFEYGDLVSKFVSSCKYFSIYELACKSGMELSTDSDAGRKPAKIIMQLAGSTQYKSNRCEVCIRSGVTALLPASSIDDVFQVEAGSRWLEVQLGTH